MLSRALGVITATIDQWAIHLARALSRGHTTIRLNWSDGRLVTENGASPASELSEGKALEISIPTDLVAFNTISLPVAAQNHIDGIVRNKLPQLSPWPVSDIFYGYKVLSPQPQNIQPHSTQTKDELQLAVAMIDARSALGDLPSIANRRRVDLSTLPVSIRTSLNDDPNEPLAMARFDALGNVSRDRSVGIYRVGLAAGLFSLAAAFFVQSAFEYWRDDRLLDLNLRQSQARLSLSAVGQSNQIDDQPGAKLRQLADSRPSRLATLNALASVLPDNTHLTELQINNLEFRFSALSDDAAITLRKIAESPLFENVSFSAPSVRDPGSGKQTSEITGQISTSARTAESMMEIFVSDGLKDESQ